MQSPGTIFATDLCLTAGKSSIFLFLQGIPACCVYNLTGSQRRLTSLQASVMEITITTHSPSQTQLPSNWDWLLFTQSTGRKIANTEPCKYACRFGVKHGNLPFLSTHLISNQVLARFWYFPEDRLSAYVEGYFALAVHDAATMEPWQLSPENAVAAGLASRFPAPSCQRCIFILPASRLRGRMSLCQELKASCFFWRWSWENSNQVSCVPLKQWIKSPTFSSPSP